MRSLLILIAITISSLSFGQKKALVGGTLIDGFGNQPIRNSVILIEGEKIVAVGTTDNIEVPDEYEVIST